MLQSVPTTADSFTVPRGKFAEVFLSHHNQDWWRVSQTKTGQSQSAPSALLPDFEFFTPPRVVARALHVDIDHQDAVLRLFEAPQELEPSWVVATPHGAQAGWFIDAVDLRPTAHRHPQDYAKAVGGSLRAYLGGDVAFHPLTPSRARNPLYRAAERHVKPNPPLYRLGTLMDGLKAAGAWQTTAQPPRGGAGRAYRGRNDEINSRAWETVRVALERGETRQWSEAQVLALVQQISGQIVARSGGVPLPERELISIARSITRHQNEPGSRGRNASETARALGAKGGRAKSAAKTAAVRQNAAKGNVVKTAQSIANAAHVKVLREGGMSVPQIVIATGLSRPSVYRLLSA